MATSNPEKYRPAPVAFQASPELRAYLDSELFRISEHLDTLDGLVSQLARLAELNGVVLLFQWEDTTDTSTAPADGYIKANNIQLSSATEFAVSAIDAYGRTVIGGNILEVGDLITVAAADLTDSHTYEVTTLPVNFGTWVNLGVAAVGGSVGYNPAQGDFVRVSWRPDAIA